MLMYMLSPKGFLSELLSLKCTLAQGMFRNCFELFPRGNSLEILMVRNECLHCGFVQCAKY